MLVMFKGAAACTYFVPSCDFWGVPNVHGTFPGVQRKPVRSAAGVNRVASARHVALSIIYELCLRDIGQVTAIYIHVNSGRIEDNVAYSILVHTCSRY